MKNKKTKEIKWFQITYITLKTGQVMTITVDYINKKTDILINGK